MTVSLTIRNRLIFLVYKQYEKTDILTPVHMKTRTVWNTTPSALKNHVHSFQYLNYQTTLPVMPDHITLRDDGIYCVGELKCVPYRVLG